MAPLPASEPSETRHADGLPSDWASRLLSQRPQLTQASVMVRVVGPDPQQKRFSGSAFFDHWNGKTLLSCSGVIIRVRQTTLVLCSGFVVLPFLQQQQHLADSLRQHSSVFGHRKCLVPGTSISLCSEASSQPISCSLAGLGRIPAIDECIAKLTSSSSAWTIGFTDSTTSPVHSYRSSPALFAVLRPCSSATVLIDQQWPVLPCRPLSMSRGEPVLSVASPFGLLCDAVFSNSVCVGHIANVVPSTGTHNARVALLDVRCLPGSEGSAVYNSAGTLLGLTTLPLRRSDINDGERAVRLGLLVPADLIAQWIHSHQTKLLRHCLGIADTTTLTAEPTLASVGPSLPSNVVTFNALRSLVAVQIARSWASGLLLRENGFVLSNAHVVRPSMSSTGRLTASLYIRIEPHNYVSGNSGSKGTWERADLVYCSSGPFDVALFKIHSDFELAGVGTAEGVCCAEPVLGQDVFVLGHALFRPRPDLDATLTQGTLAKVVRHQHDDSSPILLQTSAVVHRGNSGGMLLDHRGQLLGMVTCNAKYTTPAAPPQHPRTHVYPSLNFSIPWQAMSLLFDYVRTKDETLLERMDRKDKVVAETWTLNLKTAKSIVLQANNESMEAVVQERIERLPSDFQEALKDRSHRRSAL